MIRITGGELRGRVLPATVPDGVRPTSSRAREALFSILGQDLSGSSFLDLFSGSALMALEAWSRGARPVTAVDRAMPSIKAMRENVAAVGASVDIRVADVARLSGVVADVVYLDPPFADKIATWIAVATPLTRVCLIAEARAGSEFPEISGHLRLDQVRRYGDTAMAIYQPVGEPFT